MHFFLVNDNTEPKTHCLPVDHTLLSETKKPKSILRINDGNRLTNELVSWRKDNDLEIVSYFERDETEKGIHLHYFIFIRS